MIVDNGSQRVHSLFEIEFIKVLRLVIPNVIKIGILPKEKKRTKKKRD